MNELVRGIGTAILATSVLLPFGASAAEKSKVPGTFSANVGLVSEYYFRGISQNDDTPALQGSLSVTRVSGGMSGLSIIPIPGLPEI